MRLVTGDTDRVSVGGGSHSGRALRLASIVMLNASRDIIAKGTQIASHVLEAAAADLEFADGRFRVKGTDRSLGLFEVAAEALRRNDLPDELRGPLAAESDETVNLASFPYGCHVCEVEVDPETGVVEIVRYAAVDDVGRAVNPLIVHGQIHGGITHGLGQALSEYCVYDRETGQLLSGSLLDYALPRADRLPFFTTELSEVPTPDPPARHPPGRRRRHDPGARRRHQCDCRCARRVRRHPHRNAGDPGARLARHSRQRQRLRGGSAAVNPSALPSSLPTPWCTTRRPWRGSEPVAALDGKRHGVEIAPVGVEVLEVEEQAFVVDEMRPGMPGRDVQFDQAVARHPEGDDVLDPRAARRRRDRPAAPRRSAIPCRRASRGIASPAGAARCG